MRTAAALQLRWATVAALCCSSAGIWCYDTACADEDDRPPCDSADATETLRDCAIIVINGGLAAEGGGAYDRCLRTQLSGVVPYTTPGDNGLSYYSW
jgi:hypothetical protein